MYTFIISQTCHIPLLSAAASAKITWQMKKKTSLVKEQNARQFIHEKTKWP